VCKRAPGVVYEAMECHGGNGYTEEWGLARMYRQAPLNSIWEGSGNVICLDVLRALEKEPHSVAVFFKELGTARGAHPKLDAAVKVRTAAAWNVECGGVAV
jgi:putative acyl-CoA dehydrogenase